MDPHKLVVLKSYFNFFGIGFFSSEFVYTTMFRLCTSFWVLACTFIFNLFGFIVKYISRFEASGSNDSQKNDSNISSNYSQEDDQVVSRNSKDLDSFVYTTMFRFCTSFWVLACTFMFNLFGFIVKYISRFEASGNNDSQKNDSNISANYSQEDDQVVSRNLNDLDSFVYGGKESFKFSFGLEKSKVLDKSITEKENSGFTESARMASSTSKYQFMPEIDVIGFMEEPETHRFMLQEFILGNENEGLLEEKDSQELNLKKVDSELHEVVDHEKTEEFVQSLFREEDLEEEEEVILGEHEFCKNKETDGSEDNLSVEQESSYDEVELHPENKLFPSESDIIGSILSEDKCSSAQSISLGFELEDETFPNPDTSFSINEAEFSRYEAVSSSDEFIAIDPHFNSDKLDEQIDGLGESEEHLLEKKTWDLDSGEEDEEDIILEHRELIEHMKMEMKNARAGGLPTILEESESLKIGEDLKPLNIEEKFEHKDRMEEIQMFYKCYSEKMHKLDILNYQTMQAISFLQLKDPIQLSSVKKTPLLPNKWPYKARRIYADATLKSITELHRDLEVVYVGQACLSWEILHWQYGKAKGLLNFDSEGRQSYNQVASEFRKFQVLVQRFIEDESFQGPRVQNYVKNRSFLRCFLQVPIIKDVCLKEKKGKRDEEEDTITIAMLVDMIEETMQIFWEFLHADKCEINLILKGLPITQVDLQNPADAELLMDTKTSLHKKEKRLKEILRSGNCIVRKFQKQGGGRSYNAQFISQVELRLISRALSMSRLTTDQLVWCQNKLNNINFVNRKIYVEPLFLLFPC